MAKKDRSSKSVNESAEEQTSQNQAETAQSTEETSPVDIPALKQAWAKAHGAENQAMADLRYAKQARMDAEIALGKIANEAGKDIVNIDGVNHRVKKRPARFGGGFMFVSVDDTSDTL